MLEIWCKVLGIILVNLVDIILIVDFYRKYKEMLWGLVFMEAWTDVIILIA